MFEICDIPESIFFSFSSFVKSLSLHYFTRFQGYNIYDFMLKLTIETLFLGRKWNVIIFFHAQYF